VKGDFSLVRFDPGKHFSSVLTQQGRVALDSDHNEAAAIFNHALRLLARTVIGRHGGTPEAFAIAAESQQGRLQRLTIAPGIYWVDGIPCENEGRRGKEGILPLDWTDQPDWAPTGTAAELPQGVPVLVYLDVHERFVSAEEDESLREIALAGPDTAGRSRIVWQVKVAPLDPDSPRECRASSVDESLTMKPSWDELVDLWQPIDPSTLRARVKPSEPESDPCVIPASSAYRGLENQLYRVEIQRRGQLREEGSIRGATFKWSRDNGSRTYAIRHFSGSVVTLDHLGWDDRDELEEGDIVEVDYELRRLAGRAEPLPLLRVASIDRDELAVTLEGNLDEVTDELRQSAKVLRRWDHQPPDGAPAGAFDLPIRQSGFREQEDIWLDLEDGVQVQFPSGGNYRPYDYWLVPARVAGGRVLWPEEDGEPLALSPHGVEHHYAPLAIVSVVEGEGAQASSCRCEIQPLCGD
jgi:hypothetical protein